MDPIQLGFHSGLNFGYTDMALGTGNGLLRKMTTKHKHVRNTKKTPGVVDFFVVDFKDDSLRSL